MAIFFIRLQLDTVELKLRRRWCVNKLHLMCKPLGRFTHRRLDELFINHWHNSSQTPDISRSTLLSITWFISPDTSERMRRLGHRAIITTRALVSPQPFNYISLRHWCKWRCVIIKATQRLFLACCATLINTTSSIQMCFPLISLFSPNKTKCWRECWCPKLHVFLCAFKEVSRTGGRPKTETDASVYCGH